jgi:ATP-dependent DNA ligase
MTAMAMLSSESHTANSEDNRVFFLVFDVLHDGGADHLALVT